MPDNLAFLFAAFAVVWLLIFGYLLFLGGRIGGLRQDVEALRDEIDARAVDTGAAAPVAAHGVTDGADERATAAAEARRE